VRLLTSRIGVLNKLTVFNLQPLYNGNTKCIDFRLMAAYLLADQGHDVWLATFRGNPISSEHVNYTFKNPDYWDFSLDEQGIYDVPALIDLVLIKSGKKKLSIVCMSIGCAYVYMALTTDTSYNDKIHKIVNLAPAIHLSHVEAPGWSSLNTLSKLFQTFFPTAVHTGKMPFSENLIELGFVPCGHQARRRICVTPLLDLIGFEPSQNNHITLAKLLAVTKIRFGLKMLKHILQRVDSGKFQRFDYGPKKNKQMYGTTEAPEYDLSRVRVESMLSIISRTDRVTVPKAIKMFQDELPPSVHQSWKVVNHPDFTHLDFLLHDNVKELVYDDIIEFLEKDNQVARNTLTGALKQQAKRIPNV
ncbi:unnamed protein product, partial [Allacma fusca]